MQWDVADMAVDGQAGVSLPRALGAVPRRDS